MNRYQRGFTLIELLIVVAIIGIIAAIVTIALGNAKKSGQDSAVQSNLHTVINQAELFFADNNSYLPVGGSDFDVAACPDYNATGSNMFEVDQAMADAITEASANGSGNACANSANSWGVAIGLLSASGQSWCVDSSGIAKSVAAVPADALNASTFMCN